MTQLIRCGLYARVSSQKQADEMTIQSQVAAIRERVRRDAREVEDAAEYCDDGFCGVELLRPSLERLRDTVASGLIDRVYVHHPDRLARSLAHQAILLEEFARYGCEVVFLSQEGIPDTPEANLLIQMQGMIAEYEREKILERTRRGRRYAAKQGRLSVFARAPYGYRRIPKQPGVCDTHWEIDSENASVVKLIFELVGLHGFSLKQVQRELLVRGIPTATGKERWNNGTLHDILVNSAYQGRALYGRERMMPRKPGRRSKRGDPVIPRRSKVARPTLPEEQETILVPAIVDERLFAAVGAKMEDNRKRQREHQNGPKYLLSGLLVCGCCRSAYCARRQPRTRSGIYYRCLGGDRYRNPDKPLCDNQSVQALALEASVWDEVCTLLKNPQRIKDELARRRSQDPSNSTRLRELEKQVSTLRSQLDRLIDAHTTGLIERTEFEKRIKRVRANHNRELKSLENLRSNTQSDREEGLIANTFEQLAEKVTHGLESADFQLKRELLKLLIRVIEVHKDQIRIIYRIPACPFYQSPDKSGQLQHCMLRAAVAFATEDRVSCLLVGFESASSETPAARARFRVAKFKWLLRNAAGLLRFSEPLERHFPFRGNRFQT